jgi:hypothetical protein
LTVDAFDETDLAIAAPDLGINLLRIPAAPEDGNSLTASRIIPGRHARLPLGRFCQRSRQTLVCLSGVWLWGHGSGDSLHGMRQVWLVSGVGAT